MLGFKRLDTAAITISGVELAAKHQKHQFKVGKLPGRPATISEKPGLFELTNIG